jgi:hypothetical protein
MRKILRFRNFQESGLFKYRQDLENAIENEGFDPGFFLSANRRAWFADVVEEWLANRPRGNDPSAKPPLKGTARMSVAHARPAAATRSSKSKVQRPPFISAVGADVLPIKKVQH